MSSKTKREMRPATTPEGREQQLISLAVDLAEQRLRDGTASSQIIATLLKLATSKNRIEQEILEKQKELITAKTEAIRDSKKMEEMYKSAMDAMRQYQGGSIDE